MRPSFLPVCLLLAGCVEPYVMPADAGPVVMKPKGCSPLTCTGCCFGDQCVGGNADDACGYDGRQCAACAAGTRCEAPGACYIFDAPPASISPPSTDQIRPTMRDCFAIDGRWICT